jgi:ParB/RepB/Spo0J family partition protein
MTKSKAKIDTKKLDEVKDRLKILEFKVVPIGDIKPNEYNPNRMSEHDFELLKLSIVEDGFSSPVLVQEGTDIIVDGEHRWRAAKELGFEKIPIALTQMTPEEAMIATLRHNRAKGSEDIELVALMMRDFQELGCLDKVAGSLQMTDDEINRLIEDVDVPDALANDEFSEAWEPDDERPTDKATDTKAQEVKTGEGTLTCASSKGAVEQQREKEKQLKEAKSEEERRKLREEMRVYRLNLIFAGDEADLVKSVLGGEPAEKLLAMIGHWVDSGKHEVEETNEETEEAEETEASPAE